MRYSEGSAHVDRMSCALGHIGDRVEILYGLDPSAALSLGDELQGIMTALNDYRICATDGPGAFDRLRAKSMRISEAITHFRSRVLECMENASPLAKKNLSDILDVTLTELWDRHIHFDLDTFTSRRSEQAADALAAPFLRMEEWVTIVRTMVDEVTESVSELETRCCQPSPRPSGKPYLRVVK
ncbi:MAG: hypothetical protein EOM26_10370 [Alphaproteobacteria bacterium]|nr:hypothetical protein [Alphaproteobacteria bacterium]